MSSASRPLPTGRPRRRGPRTSPTTAGWLASVAFFFLAGLGLIGAVATVGAYASLASDLKDPRTLTQIPLPEQSIVYDRTGKVELARFGDNQREVVTFDQIPPILLDATTAIEDKTFWDNAGFDPLAIISAAVDSLRGNSRGASTITQQLVRNRLLDADLVQDPSRTAERKLKEIIQSIRVTQAFPDEPGKQQIITAYLNQNYYGNQSYGVKSAVESYFGIPLKDITPAQAAIIAGLPKSPSNYDLVRNAIERCTTAIAEGADCPKSELVVPTDTKVVERRNTILGLLAEGRTPMSRDTYSPAVFRAASKDEVLLADQTVPRWTAPHFVWAVLDELAVRLCGEGTATCDQLAQGGLRVTTTLDAKLQKVAEKWVKAATIVPHSKDPKATAKRLGLTYQPWMANLRNKNLRNGALVAQDYQTGEIVAYVGSADYYSRTSRPEFQPQYDVAGKGYRQPGSAFKPFNYAVGIDDRTITAGTMIMDTATDFGGGYSPSNADKLERGPVRARTALQFSLNIPSVKVSAVNGVEHVFAKARDFGMGFQTETTNAGLSLALGVQEVRPVDLVSAYGTLANGGRAIGHTTILAIKDPSGTDVVDPYQPPAGVQVVSPQAAFIVTDILNGNTIRSVNPFWGKFAISGPDGRRPATLKTGTNNDAKDLNAYGYIAPPTSADRDDGAYALVVGAWNGNSDNSLVSTPRDPLFSIEVTTYVWQGFLNEATAKWPETNFAQPSDGLAKVAIDPWTGLLAAPGKDSVEEWFIVGTEPRDRLASDTCGVDVLAVAGIERGFPIWMDANRDWIRRAEKGPGTVGGPDRTRTSYFYNRGFRPYGASWGALVVTGSGCGQPSPSPTCYILPTPDPSGVIPSFVVPSPSASGEIVALACPTPSGLPSQAPSGSPSPEPTPTPSPEPTPSPTATPTPEPTPAPTPAAELTPTPTATPAPTPAPEPTPAP